MAFTQEMIYLPVRHLRRPAGFAGFFRGTHNNDNGNSLTSALGLSGFPTQAANTDSKNSYAHRLTACEREGLGAGTVISKMIRNLTGTGLPPILVSPLSAQPSLPAHPSSIRFLD